MKKRTVAKKIFSLGAGILAATLMFTACRGNVQESAPSPTATVSATPEPSPTPEATPQPADQAQNKPNVNVMALKGPTAMGMVQLMNQNEEGALENNYRFTISGTADEITAELAKEGVDIFAVPGNLSSVLYNKTKSVKIMAVNTLGVLYVLDAKGGVNSIEDLRGKTIYTVGKGTTPEFALNYVLTQNGLIPGQDVTIEFKAEATELAALIDAGQADITMLPEPYVTTVISKNPDIKIALSLTEEWNKVQPDFPLITGVVAVRTGFLEENPEAVAAFLKEYKNSIDFVTSDTETAAALTAQYGITPNENVAKSALPRCNIVYIDGENMKKAVSGYLGVLLSADPKSVGGEMPGEDFYHTAP